MAESKKGGVKDDKKIKLDLLHGFGSLGHLNFKDGLVFVDDDSMKLGFPMGKYFAIRGVEKSDMNFIKLHDNLETIVSMAVSKNRRYIAVSERIRGENFPQVSIYPIKGGVNREKEKIFRFTETKSNAFVHLAFGEDTRFLVMLTGYADSQIVFLDTSRMRTMGTTIIGNGATRVSISPKDNHIVAVTGDKILKILRVQENTFNSLGDVVNLNTVQKFVEHAWIEDQRLLVANEHATVYVLYKFQVIQTITNCFSLSDNDPKCGVTAITPFSKGFLLGSDNGTLSVWVKSEEVENEMGQKSYYDFLRTRRPPGDKKGDPEAAKKEGIVSIDISPGEDMIALCFRNNDLATLSMSSLIPSTADVLDPLALRRLLETEIQLDFLYNGFHNSSVTCLDICMQRPLIATCGKDSTIRIWNYSNFKCELASVFSVLEDHKGDINPVLSLAFHPSGYYLAAGFIDKLRIFHLCAEELRLYRTLNVKNVTCLKFSNGGHMLAAAYPRPPNQSAYLINVYDSYTLEPITSSLKGPAQSVTDLVWTKRDETLVSCSMDGGVYEWKVSEDFERSDHPSSQAKFTSLTYVPTGQLVLACGFEGSNGIVKEIRGEHEHVHQINWGKLSQITSIQGFYKTNAIIGGTPQGLIKVFPGIFGSDAYDTIAAHLGEINKIIVSPDGRYVFTVGEDHCVFIFQVSEISDGGVLMSRISNVKDGSDDTKENPYYLAIDDGLADVVLVSKKDIEKARNDLKQLQLQVENLDNKLTYKEADAKKRQEEERKGAESKMSLTIQAYEKRYEELQKQKIQLEKEYANLLKMMETNHLKAVEELETLYEKKLAFENEKYLQLEQQLIEEKNKNLDRVNHLERRHEETIDKLEGQYRDEFTKTQKIFETTTQRADQIKAEYEEKLTQLEEEHELEIEEIKANHKKEIEKLTSDITKLTNENETFRREYKETTDENSNLRRSEQEKDNDIKQLKLKLQEANSTIEALRREVEDREETIKKKENKIYEYKYKINDLQKSKHVLSYRTTEMRKSLEPKEAQIEKLKEELFKLEGEFENMLKTSQIQNEKLANKEKKIEELNNKLKTKNEQYHLKETLIKDIIMKMHDAVKTKDKKEWGYELKKLYDQYVQQIEIKQESSDPRSVEEMMRQIQHLEKSIYQMNKSSEKMVQRREKDIYRKTMENSDLICDLNDLRKANKKLESDVYNSRKENDQLSKRVKNLEEENHKLQALLGKMGKDDSQEQGGMAQYTQTYSKKDSNAMPPLFRLKQDTSGNLPKGKVAKGSMFDLKAQSINDRNKLVELMAEMDLCNQRIMQQDSEIRFLREKLRKYGVEEGMRYGSIASQTHSIEGVEEANIEMASSPNHDKFQAMKSGLQVRQTLARMAQHEEGKNNNTIN